MSDEDSLDGWLVGDEEDVGGEPIDLAELEDAEFDIKNLKRKKAPTEDSGAASKDKRRKVVVPLVPFIRGPYWETNIGECPTWDGFIPHQIQLFNGE
jgi:chromatin assembly factor 1 subunit A